MLKILFAGTPDVAVPSLRALAADSEHFEVVAVLTRPDAPTGRGRSSRPARSRLPRWNWDCRYWNPTRPSRRSLTS